jgi:ribose transport system substrate-binding protein
MESSTLRRLRSWPALAGLVAAAALGVSACGSSDSSSGGSGSSGTQTQSLKEINVKATGPAAVKVGTECGDTVAVGPTNKDSELFQQMSDKLKSAYAGYPDALQPSGWATKEITAKPPWKIGYITVGVSNQYQNNVLKQLKAEFAAAKKQGLVTGELVTNIPPSLAQSTPESQIAAMKQMASQGVNAIIINPADSVAESPTMEQLGEQGVPVVLADIPPVPNTKYQGGPWTQNQVEADAGTLGIINASKDGKKNILIVRGIAGNQNDKVLYNQKIQDLKNCPDINVAATLYGNWDNGTAKQVVSQYLASHPEPIDGVLQDGGMFAGVVQAFESRGIKVPPVGMEQCAAGDLSWWLDHPDYKTVAGCINGLQGGYTYFNSALRILANKKPKYQTMSIPGVAIDQTNLKAYAQPGLPLTSDLELPGPKTAWCDNTCLDQYFEEPGPATADGASK